MLCTFDDAGLSFSHNNESQEIKREMTKKEVPGITMSFATYFFMLNVVLL